ncbi:MAG: hypothetical protein WD794_00105 [Mycobacteriales bacterium]
MTERKQRLTVTVDPALVAAASRAVADGQADSVSGWVSAALSEKVDRERKLGHLRVAIADYEAEFGEITAEEMVDQARADREDAVVVRSRGTRAAGRVPGRAKAASG